MEKININDRQEEVQKKISRKKRQKRQMSMRDRQGNAQGEKPWQVLLFEIRIASLRKKMFSSFSAT